MNTYYLSILVVLGTLSLSGANSASANEWQNISCSKSPVKLDYTSLRDAECWHLQEIHGSGSVGVFHFYQSQGWGPQYWVTIMRAISKERGYFYSLRTADLGTDIRVYFHLQKATAWGYASSKNKVKYIPFDLLVDQPMSCYGFYTILEARKYSQPTDYLKGYYCKNKTKEFSVNQLLRLVENVRDGKRVVKPEVRTQDKTRTVDSIGEGTPEERLTKLKNIFDKGLINNNEYENKRQEILDSF